MLNYKITTTIVLLALFAGFCSASCTADDREQAQQFFDTFCVSCHGQKSPKGGLRLDQIDLKRWDDASLLEDIYTAIQGGEMPPEEAVKHPGADQSKELQNALLNRLRLLAEKQPPGMLKRLSRVEYQNTVNDVFGTEFSLLDQLPLDNINAGL